MPEPEAILDAAVRRAEIDINSSLIVDERMRSDVSYVALNLTNRAGVRLLMACLLAKLHRPDVDIRKPYTEIGDPDVFSGRTYDERYITSFINRYNLPCNSTTAFLTPALRNRSATLTKDLDLVGKPPQLYRSTLNLLDDVYSDRVIAADLIAEIVRLLLRERDARQQRIDALATTIDTTKDAIPLAAEDIINLIDRHMSLKGTSRLAVLVVAAAYRVAGDLLGERVLALHAHNAADRQTGALGDLEIILIDDDRVVTSYEMKHKRVNREDLDIALQKISNCQMPIDNYIFITTDRIDPEVREYALSLYQRTGGIEFIILDCISFTRHFLHLFHRLRSEFLETYQALILAEPHSAVSQPLKEAFLAMRQAAEVGREEI
jgi:putative NIF3 family GTP cyclohydrolase 1 type 2